VLAIQTLVALDKQEVTITVIPCFAYYASLPILYSLYCTYYAALTIHSLYTALTIQAVAYCPVIARKLEDAHDTVRAAALIAVTKMKKVLLILDCTSNRLY
jgi:hypothetical protein